MIHFIVATNSEARPIVNFYNLKKKKTIANFVIYKNNSISLTVSGIGKINTSMGITHTFHEFNQQKNNIWINLGIAGHKKEKIGNIFLIDKITDDETKKTIYPFIFDNCKIKQKSCITYNMANFNYTNDLSDMEVSGFFFACEKYSTKELIHSLKIISDNEKEKINFSDKEIINCLILKKINKIDLFAKRIYNIWSNHFEKKKNIEKEINNILVSFDLTFSEKEELKKWLKIFFYSPARNEKDFINQTKNFRTIIKNIKKKLEI